MLKLTGFKLSPREQLVMATAPLFAHEMSTCQRFVVRHKLKCLLRSFDKLSHAQLIHTRIIQSLTTIRMNWSNSYACVEAYDRFPADYVHKLRTACVNALSYMLWKWNSKVWPRFDETMVIQVERCVLTVRSYSVRPRSCEVVYWLKNAYWLSNGKFATNICIVELKQRPEN